MATNTTRNTSQSGTKEDDGSSLNRSNAFDEREFISKLLSEKRTLLATLHNEKKEKIKWKEEYERKVEEFERLQRHNGIDRGVGSCAHHVAALNLDDEDNERKHLYRKLREKDDKISEIQGKNDRLLNQVAVLKTEVIRLAKSLTRLDAVQSDVDTDLLREQLELYEQDFKKEKDDKVNAQERLSILSEQLRENQEMIQNLTVEVDMYKKAYEREKLEKEKILIRKSKPGNDSSRNSSVESAGFSRRHQSLPKPHLQVVYPVTNDRGQQDDVRRRRQLQQIGVLTRDIQRSPTHLHNCEPEPDSSVQWWST